jgi:hypothetical protein
MLAVVLLELAKSPSLSPIKKKFPEDPAIVVVCPTTALEDECRSYWFYIGIGL